MIKIFILIMVISDGAGSYRPVTIQQEFNSLETCQQTMKSIQQQVYRVHSMGCYDK